MPLSGPGTPLLSHHLHELYEESSRYPNAEFCDRIGHSVRLKVIHGDNTPRGPEGDGTYPTRVVRVHLEEMRELVENLSNPLMRLLLQPLQKTRVEQPNALDVAENPVDIVYAYFIISQSDGFQWGAEKLHDRLQTMHICLF